MYAVLSLKLGHRARFAVKCGGSSGAREGVAWVLGGGSSGARVGVALMLGGGSSEARVGVALVLGGEALKQG